MYYFKNVGCRHINSLDYFMSYFTEEELELLEEMAKYINIYTLYPTKKFIKFS